MSEAESLLEGFAPVRSYSIEKFTSNQRNGWRIRYQHARVHGLSRSVCWMTVCWMTVCFTAGCKPRDSAAGDSAAGDSAAGDSAAGDSAAGDMDASQASPAVVQDDLKTVDSDRVELLTSAESSWKQGDLALASKLVQQQLLRTPEDPLALLLAGKIAADEADLTTAIDLVATIPLDSDLSVESTELLVKWYLAAGQYDQAVIRLQAGLTQSSLRPTLKVAYARQLWALLNRLGRRQQASAVADQLCRSGYVGGDVLISLLRRGDAFPLALGDDSPKRHFYPGLGLARWFFSQEDFQRALEMLGSEGSNIGNQDTNHAADALRGRLLAELQQTDEFVKWCQNCDPESRQYSDYWIALGIYFFDQQQLEASADALMEGVYLDPTDDDGCHRLARVLAALQQDETAALMREHAIRVATLKNLVKQLSIARPQPDLTADLPAQLLSIARPIEAIGWALSNLGPGNEVKRLALMQQFANLRQDPTVPSMSSEYALMEMERNSQSHQDVLKRLSEANSEASNVADSNIASEDAVGGSVSNPVFVNVARDMGIDFKWFPNQNGNLESLPMHEMMGGGIAVCDFDLDGKPDIYLAQGSGDPPDGRCSKSNLMYRNLGQHFLDVTKFNGAADFGYSSGIAAGDVNQDGFPDLYIGSLGCNRLLINNGDGTYQDATEHLGEAPPQFTSSVAIADLTGDGMPDLFECVYVEMKDGFRLPDRTANGKELPPNPNDFYAESDRWYLSQGNGSMALQVLDRQSIEPGTALGLVVTDVDGDGANDVFVANDARPNHLLMRFGSGNVANVADLVGLGYGFRGFSNSCMGIAAGDFNRDGRFDLQVTNFLNESNNLFLQGEGGLFSDYSVRYGLNSVCEPYTGFGIKKIDLDRNGWPDFVVTNGHVFDQRSEGIDFQMYPQVLMNEGSRLRANDHQAAGSYFGGKHVGRSMSVIDYDGDRDLDLLVGHLDSPIALLENRTETRNSGVQFELIGTQSERDGIGCRVVVHFAGQSFTDWVVAGDGYLSSDEPVLDFGVGNAGKAGSVEVHWPSGQRQRFEEIEPGERYVIVEGSHDIWRRTKAGGQSQGKD